MKRLICTAAVLAAITTPAAAQESFAFQPYIGFDLQHTRMSYDNYDDGVFAFNWDEGIADNLNGANIHVGARVHEHIGVELGYFRTQEKSKSFELLPGVQDSSDVQLSGLTLDALAYLPVTERVDLIATAGVSRIKAELDGTIGGVAFSDDESEFGFRAGAGAQVGLTDRLNLRGLVRYQQADFDDVADHALTYSAGLNYGF